MYQSPALLPDPGELCLAAGGAVRLAPRHRAVGQIQGHGEWDEVSIVKLRSRSGSGEGELWGRYKVMENGMRSVFSSSGQGPGQVRVR